MDTRVTEAFEEAGSENPEDVAVLYSWANMPGAKYRDFSASRREFRAQVRHDVAERLHEAELTAKSAAEAAAVDAERAARDAEQLTRNAEQAAREAERAARLTVSETARSEREGALRKAEEAVRRAGAERVEAARHAEAAAVAEAIARREEREIAEAHASALRQAKTYSDAEIRRRSPAGPQEARLPGADGDPYEEVLRPEPERSVPERDAGFRPGGGRFHEDYPSAGARSAYPPEFEERRRPQLHRPDEKLSGFHGFGPAAESNPNSREGSVDDFAREAAPAWPYAGSAEQPSSRGPRPLSSPGPVLAPSKDVHPHPPGRVALRWFASREGFAEAGVGAPATMGWAGCFPALMTVFSLAGGVGKTSMVAALGRALSLVGEKVILADMTSQGLLPYYFGTSELRPGVVRTILPSNGSAAAPIHMVAYGAEKRAADEAGQRALLEDLAQAGSSAERMLLDVNAGSGWILRQFGGMSPVVLVPVAPDMNSVISLRALERYLEGANGFGDRAIQPYYLLNGFDGSLPLHLDIREMLGGRLGERLLPFVIRRSPAVGEALAEGMTVIDYAPADAAAEDYRKVAGWVRSLSVAASQGLRRTRWSER